MKGKAVDRVCGMTVDKDKAFAAWSYEGVVYYFCAACCQQRFQEDPDKYLGDERDVLHADVKDGSHD
ncbi:MAG: YHS domain-containing protein [Gammaproteobacteria bacterium]|nr:YHS domain-containing protein [Gammaproteobacteria bacterium]NIU52792.1 YHS domain-containing protein [Gemmatimonadota bacterium]NIR85090.1 YHS domain-containing protein [Gammaproteobacteria bacterium]NIU06136.1 YHS domain-containing protein [Gammaproteobacteria bacterium]NIV53083.1 YHS domain-containing protein [Gammaproteobacteria bacterium]